ncbi:hypothetical protein [Microterricola pindariensis]|uniref:Lipoprotein n=1 Tax=Microterricola pindariensis TaxID=478010 RepID=A0ABX5AYW0_9MICO|nr:hypothetical protein [Microterricola pindariensis]PPL20080.1 hypothetical protein GY24_02965 [Microterricola pindariensis]
MNRYHALLPLAAAAALALVGCSSPPPLSAQDSAALETLAAVAGPTSNVSAHRISSTECWLPSTHAIEDAAVDSSTLWRVICRVHYTDETGERYQDATCIGDFALEPMLDHCYRWAHYDFAPAFEDFPAVTAS